MTPAKRGYDEEHAEILLTMRKTPPSNTAFIFTSRSIGTAYK